MPEPRPSSEKRALEQPFGNSLEPVYCRSGGHVELAESVVKRDFTRGANCSFTSVGRNTAVRDEARERGTRCEVISTIGSFKSNRVKASISSTVFGCRGSNATMAQSGRQFIKNSWTPMRSAQMVEKPSRRSKRFAVAFPNSFDPMIRMFLFGPISSSRLRKCRRHKPPALRRSRYHAPQSSAPTCFAYWHSMCLQYSSGGSVPRTQCQIRRVSRLERDPS
jgi:hypothetical protein